MSQKSAIEWTEATWNPVRGCVKVSPGCAHCYAETFAERFRGVTSHPYEQGFDLRLVPEKLDEPLKRKKPTMYFVNSMSDLFQDGVPDEFIDRVFRVMARTPQHTYQVLTKRAARLRDYCLSTLGFGHGTDQQFNTTGIQIGPWPLPNVWLGVSVENQYFADERIPLLLQTPAAVRFISAEPLLGPVNLETWIAVDGISEDIQYLHLLDWVIVGGESGPGARAFDVAWARSIVKQCKEAGVACFMKQFGAKPLQVFNEVERHDLLLRDRKGGDMTEWPEDLRVREFPLPSNT